VTTVLLQHLPREHWELHLAVAMSFGQLYDVVPEDVAVHQLGAVRVRGALLPLLRLVRALRPRVVLSTVSYVNLALLGLRRLLPAEVRIVIREPTILSQEVARKPLAPLWRLGYRRLYARADAIVCPARTTFEDLVTGFGLPRERMRRIPNPIDVARIRAAARADSTPLDGPGPHIVGVGRLSPEKGYDRAIRAFAEVVSARPEARLWLVGEGPAEADLAECIRGLGLEQSVRLVGYVRNPYPWFRRADAFLQTSHYEGMPNALLESLACGTRVVALAAPGGTREVVEAAGPGARLVESAGPGALARALLEMTGPERPPAPTLPAEYSADAVAAALDELLTAL
jgi:glycosyltransferase involved in cell wall biosynthesis